MNALTLRLGRSFFSVLVIAAALVAFCPGCMLTRLTHRALIQPTRTHLATELVGCSVVEAGGKVDVTLLFRLENGELWQVDPSTTAGGMSVKRGHRPRGMSSMKFFTGRVVKESVRLPRATMPCVASESYQLTVGKNIRMAAKDGRIGAPSPLDQPTARAATRLVTLPDQGQKNIARIRIYVPPPGGRRPGKGGKLYTGHDLEVGPPSTYLSPPPNPSVGGTVGYILLAPLTGLVDLVSAPIQLVILLIAWG